MSFHSHRARAIAAKSISSKSSAHISEILGVAPTASTSTQDPTGETSETRITSTSDAEELETGKITTSTKCLADYFNEKLNARNQAFKSTYSATLPSSSSDTGGKNSYDAPRMGLGSTRLRIEAQVEEEIQRVGLSKSSSLSSSSFLAATSSSSSYIVLSTERETKVNNSKITEIQSESITAEDGTKKLDEVKRKKILERGDGPHTDNGAYQRKKDRKRKGEVEKTREKGKVTNKEDGEKRKKEREREREI